MATEVTTPTDEDTSLATVPAVPRDPPPADDELTTQREKWLVRVELRRTLVAQGWTDKALRRYVRSGQLAQPRRGAYVDASHYRGLDVRGRHAMTSRAVLQQAVVDCSLSHDSGAVWYGGPEWGLDLDEVNITRHDGRTGRREAGVRQHRGLILDGDLVDIGGISVMSPTRCGLELTTVHDVEVGLVHVNHLLHTGQTTVEELQRRFALMREWPGALSTEIVLRLADGRLENLLESRFFHLCFRNSLPMPEPQYRVEDHDGQVVARLDFAWPKLRRYAETDGVIKYGQLLEDGQTARDVVLKEKERDKMVNQITGMEGERFTWNDVDKNEARTVVRLRRMLGLD